MPAMVGLNVDMKSRPMTIGEVADHFGLPAHVLRHWESVGLLSPARVEGGRRRYTRDDLFRVASIVRAKEAGLSLPDIRAFLAARDPATHKDVLSRNHRALQDRMAALRSALDLLEAGLNCSHEDIATCPNYRAHLTELVDVTALEVPGSRLVR
ncbi:MerR family transcriptional regulator [Micromonospora sp. NBC_00858]|uniref:MerR family transcriptional regulator n=1 Tax=Micromonospora sp. NBC_00858 TaxID=2975979 RepID=UPI00386C2A17|nr:MerR family transcriptional regulator [Micromonospora sp. NBC_00858]